MPCTFLALSCVSSACPLYVGNDESLAICRTSIAFTDSTRNIQRCKTADNEDLYRKLQSPECVYFRCASVRRDGKQRYLHCTGEQIQTDSFWQRRFGYIQTYWYGTNEHSLANWYAPAEIWEHCGRYLGRIEEAPEQEDAAANSSEREKIASKDQVVLLGIQFLINAFPIIERTNFLMLLTIYWLVSSLCWCCLREAERPRAHRSLEFFFSLFYCCDGHILCRAVLLSVDFHRSLDFVSLYFVVAMATLCRAFVLSVDFHRSLDFVSFYFVVAMAISFAELFCFRWIFIVL